MNGETRKEPNWAAIARFVAAVLAFLAIPKQKYAFYKLVRWGVCGVSAYSAFDAYTTGRKVWMVVFIAIAILFNPFAPFHFEKEIWVALDALTGIVYLVSMKFFRSSMK